MADKKSENWAEPGYDVFFLCMLVFSAVGFFFHGMIVGVAETIAVFALWLLYRRSSRRKKREIINYMESVTLEVNSAGSLAVADFPVAAGRRAYRRRRNYLGKRPVQRLDRQVYEYRRFAHHGGFRTTFILRICMSSRQGSGRRLWYDAATQHFGFTETPRARRV